MNFRQFLENKIQNAFSQNTVGTHNDHATAIFLPPSWTGAEDLSKYGIPDISLGIPTVVKKSKIRSVELNKNPITVSLMDGTKLHLTLDEFNRIEKTKKLEVGKELSVTFQRNPEYHGNEPSKIIEIK